MDLITFSWGLAIAQAIILFLIISIPGFFLWRALLRFFVKKGPKGINIAALIIAVALALVLTGIALVISMWQITTRETEIIKDQLKKYNREQINKIYYDSIPFDTTQFLHK